MEGPTPATCLICMDELASPMNGVPGKRRQKTVYKPDDCWRLRCGHMYCVGCLSGWVASKIEERSVPIVCASLNCSREVRPPHIAAILSGKLFEKFSELVTAKMYEADSMYCPNKQCSQVFVKPSFRPGQEKTTCLLCETILCLRCQVGWHDGLNCDEYKRMIAAGGDSDEAQLYQLKYTFQWKQCPKCNILVERSTGCNYMRCKCGEPFCYACGVPYAEKVPTPDHPHGKPGCQCGLNPRNAENADRVDVAMAGALAFLRQQLLHGRAAATPEVAAIDLVRQRLQEYPVVDAVRERLDRMPGEFEDILLRHLPLDMHQHRVALRENFRRGLDMFQNHLPLPLGAAAAPAVIPPPPGAGRRVPRNNRRVVQPAHLAPLEPPPGLLPPPLVAPLDVPVDFLAGRRITRAGRMAALFRDVRPPPGPIPPVPFTVMNPPQRTLRQSARAAAIEASIAATNTKQAAAASTTPTLTAHPSSRPVSRKRKAEG
ncbi:hypothetical protein H310_13156 [Aphanomyces invadans]|uniref:RBR-type E3 ubiquitin transferase n=1 Tax=Aphanomyces invadans TaxID=157072 RepID=A0A024TEZ6_9STRA|nr:hypothetical protein H310_13156 [Aphanomyces invadans]ETV92735.1 hypothetical protein H310_13156 [Aphanomyces invadans]|eukprot:XP_008878771.1 hypothetical protein H310_13156 [Aphanomyces invadans]